MHHSIWKTIFDLGADEYLEDWKAKLESAYSFMLKYSKITVWEHLSLAKLLKGFTLILLCLILLHLSWPKHASIALTVLEKQNIAGKTFFFQRTFYAPIPENTVRYKYAQYVYIFYSTTLAKVEKILKDNLDLIPSPTPSVKIQIMGGKVCLRCEGKTLLELFVFKSLLTSPSNVLPYYLK